MKFTLNYFKFVLKVWRLFLIVILATGFAAFILFVVLAIIFGMLELASPSYQLEFAVVLFAFIGLPLFAYLINGADLKTHASLSKRIYVKDIRTLCLLVDRQFNELRSEFEDNYNKEMFWNSLIEESTLRKKLGDKIYKEDIIRFSHLEDNNEEQAAIRELSKTYDLLYALQDLIEKDKPSDFFVFIEKDGIKALSILLKKYIDQIQEEYEVKIGELPHHNSSLSLDYDVLFSKETTHLYDLNFVIDEFLIENHNE